jgi:hypothetical protein
MTLTILGGALKPKVHDGVPIDQIYGIDALGNYVGLVPAAMAASAACCPPPKSGEWRWDGAAWQPYLNIEAQILAIEAERDAKLNAGVQWNGFGWYTDDLFQQQLAAYLQSFSEGILPVGSTVMIRRDDGVVVPLTRDDLRALAGSVLAYVQGVWQWSWNRKAQVRAQPSPPGP